MHTCTCVYFVRGVDCGILIPLWVVMVYACWKTFIAVSSQRSFLILKAKALVCEYTCS